MKPLSALIRTDLTLYFSNRRALAITLAAPILIAAFFGAVMGGPPKKPIRVPIAALDQDQSDVTRGIVASLKADTNFELRELPEAEAIDQVRNGKVRALVVLPKGFGEGAPRAMFRGNVDKPVITVHFDPSQSMTMPLVKGLLAQHVMESVSRNAFGSGPGGIQAIAKARGDVEKSTALDATDRRDLLALFDTVTRLQTRATAPSGAAEAGFGNFQMPFTTQEREVTGKTDRKYNGYSHSFAGFGVQFVLFMGIELGVGVLLMRRLGLWKRLRAAPLSKRLLLGSRVASGTLIALILMGAIYAAGIAVFGVRVDGSWIGFIAVNIAFAILASTFGLLIASVGRTPEATRGLAILATLLLVMLGGAWVPTFVFPDWLQTATVVVPTRWAIDGLEAMTWRGLDLSAAYAPVAVMLAFSAAFATIALALFKWEE